VRPPFNCLFCRTTAGPFNRIEHPIPESLGNDDLTLEKGFVCDRCNQYFGSKVEARVLASPPFNIERTTQAIRTKKGKLASFHEKDLSLFSTGSANALFVASQGDDKKTLEKISRGLVIPQEPRSYDNLFVSFFLKLCLELLLTVEGGVPYSPLFDAARRCARYGEGCTEWDVAWGIYPNRNDLYISSRVDEFGLLDTHQIYQWGIGRMASGDVILSFVFVQCVFACNLSRPSIMEYLLGFNARNSFPLYCRWNRQR
jgi:hypothetical protein